jgi:hypothetical protein
MEIHLSEKFSQIEVISRENDSVTIQCALWPSWNEMHEATRDQLSLAELEELETLFRSENACREFEIEDQVLKIRSTHALAI